MMVEDLHGHCSHYPHGLVTNLSGVDENYASVDFYASHLSRDNSRVNQLFRDSHLNGVKVIEETIHMDTILDFLESKQMMLQARLI